MKRYSLEDNCLDLDEHGNWVRFEDVETTIVLPAKIYDEAKAAGILSEHYKWVRQETIPLSLVAL